MHIYTYKIKTIILITSDLLKNKIRSSSMMVFNQFL